MPMACLVKKATRIGFPEVFCFDHVHNDAYVDMRHSQDFIQKYSTGVFQRGTLVVRSRSLKVLANDTITREEFFTMCRSHIKVIKCVSCSLISKATNGA